MKVIVGLGNPGKKFKGTRHNVGADILDFFSKKKKFPKFKLEKKIESEISEKKLGKEKVILLKPQTFINNSGKAIKSFTESYKLKAESLFVIHDDLDIPIGKFKISIGKGSGGHKGVQSIINELGTKDFVRFRIGIGPRLKIKTKNFVLEKFTRKEKKILKKVSDKVCQAIEMAIGKGVEKAMQKYNI
jgi:PTH1 family peptidyl-tRNA hydrolase